MELILANVIIKLFIFANLFSLLLSRFFNMPKNILCCGIFGFSGKEGKKANHKKLKMLGVYNVQRGIDSCGYYYNGNIVKGIADKANFSVLIDSQDLIPGDLDAEVFIGHTRKSTCGGNTESNAHPHIIGNYVQTHNGVLKNIWELCREYDIDHSKITVDSIGLAHIIEKVGFKILHRYEGFAALAMTYMDKPDELYLYHGASREKKDGEIWGERPLFVLNQPEGMYYSSLKESLSFISENKSKPAELPHNCVFKIKKGKLTDFEYLVHRDDVNLPKHVAYYTQYPSTNQLPFSNQIDDKKAKVIPLTSSKPVKSMVWLEAHPPEYVTQDVYYRKGRHYTGDNILLNGEYEISRAGKIIKNGEVSDRMSEKYYFVRGAMLASLKAYKKLFIDRPTILSDLGQNTAYYLSRYTRYPVICTEQEGVNIADELRYVWYKDGKKYSSSFSPKFSSRQYNIKLGVLQTIGKTTENDKIFTADRNKILTDIVDNDIDFVMQIIIDDINKWGNKIIDEVDITSIPEHFLMFVDMYNQKYHTEEVSDRLIEEETTTIINDLLKTKQSFITYLVQFLDASFFTEQNMRKCFEKFEVEELLEFENRYNYSPFEVSGETSIAQKMLENIPSSEEVAKETLAEEVEYASLEKEQSQRYLIDAYYKLKELIVIADELQTLNRSDEAQDGAISIYRAVTEVENRLTTISTSTDYKELANTIKSK